MSCRVLPLAALLLVMAGCNVRPTPLERTTFQLSSGMKKSEVKRLFASFEVTQETNQVLEIAWFTKFYKSNNLSASSITYAPRSSGLFHLWEGCIIYFDTNEVIVAHLYHLND